MKRKLAIIGAGLFQRPLIVRARQLGFETHVFAWTKDAVGAPYADFFYPISITEHSAILRCLRRIKPMGITSIASDLAMPTVASCAAALGLPTNPPAVIATAIDKYRSRCVFSAQGLSVPRFARCSSLKEARDGLKYVGLPAIIKPVDRSGSRGVSRIDDPSLLPRAYHNAMTVSFGKATIIEQFIAGREFSVEVFSWRGVHRVLALTEKFTTGAPHYIETGHLEPAKLTAEITRRVNMIICKGLAALVFQDGAAHGEVIIDNDGKAWIVEIGPRMGGDFIGSHLVPLSTGHDFLGLVIRAAIGERPVFRSRPFCGAAGVGFHLFKPGSVAAVHSRMSGLSFIDESGIFFAAGDRLGKVADSVGRHGYFITRGATRAICLRRMRKAWKSVTVNYG